MCHMQIKDTRDGNKLPASSVTRNVLIPMTGAEQTMGRGLGSMRPQEGVRVKKGAGEDDSREVREEVDAQPGHRPPRNRGPHHDAVVLHKPLRTQTQEGGWGVEEAPDFLKTL